MFSQIQEKLKNLKRSPARSPQAAIAAIKKNPESALLWIDLICLELPAMEQERQKLAAAHKLNRKGVIMSFLEELDAKLGPDLVKKAAILDEMNTRNICADVIQELVRLKTIIQCRDTHATGGYFSDAEQVMAWQWGAVIQPMIKDLDFSCVLELAPGHGRNTEHIRKLAKEIHLVDVNVSCVEACQKRFGRELEGCSFYYYVTDGGSLSMIPSASITHVYSFDSMVHFDKLVVKDYVREIARGLLPGGTAFLHHSNFGAFKPNSDWAHNVGTRSDMSAALMVDYATAVGLAILFQRLSGKADGWGMDDLDCFSILQRTASALR